MMYKNKSIVSDFASESWIMQIRLCKQFWSHGAIEELKVFGIFCQFDVYSFSNNNNTLVLKLPAARMLTHLLLAYLGRVSADLLPFFLVSKFSCLNVLVCTVQ